ncbi:MAG: hypothetical protein NTX74_02540 [Flavobacterium sp.]|nr:hypothetical protein [Flavobacterium sp.]
MKISSILFVAFFCLALACQKDQTQLLMERQKDAQRKEQVFQTINRAWHFSIPSLAPHTRQFASSWNDLYVLNNELNQKPKSTLGAFQKKARLLSQKSAVLANTIPMVFNKPEIKSRIAVLTTKFNQINLYINVTPVQDQKVVSLITEVNIELKALYLQLDEIVRKSEIPTEEGETEMKQMLDTTRAIPSK